ncbi:hypothetical protein H696_01427 [Fonticula alba]|uniref:J domain-containing protein n=1 Tax=Fonticula alba TaxID=691883 RepID=A0A058ZC86_FONAL|nr:hypothetical protein H696_01427 [Fonticula alba]KCV72020.1 hypothetical protein H696_01427 [Fonticula alba]|eukprot:XP_009493598.1 hypothetical protein H696_01427 [Fonticula alba]
MFFDLLNVKDDPNAEVVPLTYRPRDELPATAETPVTTDHEQFDFRHSGVLRRDIMSSRLESFQQDEDQSGGFNEHRSPWQGVVLFQYFRPTMFAVFAVGCVYAAVRSADIRKAARLFNFRAHLYNLKSLTDTEELIKPNNWFEKTMNREEALNIMNIEGRYTLSDLNAIHRKLITQNHPDRGGSEFLCNKINEARDLLERTMPEQ